MSKLLKNNFSKEIITSLADNFKKHYKAFNTACFMQEVFEGFDSLELKERSARITCMMRKYLPQDFKKAALILRNMLENSRQMSTPNSEQYFPLSGFIIMPLADYIGLYGAENFDLSMTLFNELTKRFTAEYGIRHFILKMPEKTLCALKKFTKDESADVRRLASEGVRPKLPWACEIPFLNSNLPLIIDILKELIDDDSEYVRRSVANNLNDISKKDPKIVLNFAANYLPSVHHFKLFSHALRSLLKSCNQDALSALGYLRAQILDKNISLKSAEGYLDFTLKFTLKESQDLIIYYIISDIKKSLKHTKIFTLKKITKSAKKSYIISKKHHFKPLQTRKYHAGEHVLKILVNGVLLVQESFWLTLKP